jgi:hypothetical protein
VTLFSDAPATLVAGAAVAIVLTAVVSALLAWHGLRRVLDIPRVPRPRAMYWALAVVWAVLATACAGTVMAAFLLRDHERLVGRTQIGELRCEATGPGRVRVELKTAKPSGPAAERYDIDGDACVVSVREVELRPGLRALGIHDLARVYGVGPEALPTAGPSWLTLDTAGGARLLGLVVRRTHAVPVVVPADPKQRFVLVAAPGRDPVLEPAPI